MISRDRVIVFLIWIMPVFFIFYFGYLYFINSRYGFEINYNFCQNSTGRFTGLSPVGRVENISKENCSQKMIIDPVYFDVRIPRQYKRAVIYTDYVSDTEFKIGVAKDLQKWEWKFAEAKLKDKGDYKQAKFVFNLDDIDFDKKLRFIISAPGLQYRDYTDLSLNKSIIFYNFKVIFQ